MASLFKKTFAAVLAIAMVVTCFTVSAADAPPTLNVTSAYVKIDATETTVDIYTENFDAIYGSQFTVTLPAGYVATSIKNNAENDFDWEVGSNCKIFGNGNVIKFLDVRTNKGFNITINVTVPEEASGVKEIIVDKTYFIDSNEAEYDDVLINRGVISVETAVEASEDETETVNAQDGYFIPYGEVMVGDEYVDKKEDGSFTVTGNTTYTQIKLPSKEVGVTTFGTGEKLVVDKFGPAGIQFGSYAINAAGKNFGTLAIKGDFADFKAYCKAEKGMTDKAIYDRLVSLYNAYKEKNPNGKSIGVQYGNDQKISVLCIAQRKYMWYSLDDNDDVNHLQYAARITNPIKGETYSGIAYSYIEDAYTFSKEVKDITK